MHKNGGGSDLKTGLLFVATDWAGGINALMVIPTSPGLMIFKIVLFRQQRW